MMAFWHAMFFGILGPLVGAAVLIGVIMPLTLGMGEQVGASDFPVALLFVTPGAVAASLCMLLADWRASRLPPNKRVQLTCGDARD